MSKQRKGQILAVQGQNNWDGEWTVCQVQGVIDLYRTAPPGEIAGLIGKTEPAVINMAGRLGLRKKRPNWLPTDCDYLESYWGAQSVPTIAKKLNRTQQAVLLKARQMNLGPTKQDPDRLTARELARMLKIDEHTVADYWVKKCGLKAQQRVTRIKQKLWRIRIEDFWTWAEHNQDKFDSRRFARGVLGKEPEWMQLKRQRDKHLPARQKQNWTPEEDARLISLFRAGVTRKEIGNRLGRSKSAIEHRLMRIGWERIWEPRETKTVNWK